jgi:hypothetical protein
MINHISINAHNPERVAGVLAELWNGYVFPFPPSPNSFIVLADDGRGTAVEVTPINIELLPGKGLPAEDETFDSQTPTEEYEAKFTERPIYTQYSPTHLNINTPLSAEEVKAIAKRERWRVLTCNRGEGLFQLLEVWAENRLMIEVMTPEMTERYVNVMNPQFIADAMQITLPPKPFVANNLTLIG